MPDRRVQPPGAACTTTFKALILILLGNNHRAAGNREAGILRHGLLLIAALVMCVACAAPSQGADLAHGVAITDPDVLQTLDEAGLNLARMMGADANSSGADLFALPSMSSVQVATDRDFNRYVVEHKDASGRLTLFDREALNAPGTRFELVGIVNRMDRAYVSPDGCGEIRLIYRPVSNHGLINKSDPPSRLPMTFNLVMRAKPANADIACAEIAKRWLALSVSALAGAGRAKMQVEKGGALEWIAPDAIDRIELNIQVARESADANDLEGRADYLMKVFRLDPQRKFFKESPLENQIDAGRIRADAGLAADFRQWLLDPSHLADLDRGTIVLPDRFLALSAINETPSHMDAESSARDLLTDDDIVAALAKASAQAPFQNIWSPAGFARRLDDITCSGCHRTRAIGGFHFPGMDRSGHNVASMIVTPASPHFFGDQERRRDILTAFRDGREPDFSRGFSARPQQRRASELSGTTYLNGWGAVCYPADGAAPDKSFSSWTCAEGLTCQAAPGAKDSRAGFCFLKSD